MKTRRLRAAFTRPDFTWHFFYLTSWLVFTLVLSGCVSPIALNRAVLAYDEAITSAASKQLLVNIARARHHQPVHFTGVSNIAATFDFRFNAGATPALEDLQAPY